VHVSPHFHGCNPSQPRCCSRPIPWHSKVLVCGCVRPHLTCLGMFLEGSVLSTPHYHCRPSLSLKSSPEVISSLLDSPALSSFCSSFSVRMTSNLCRFDVFSSGRIGAGSGFSCCRWWLGGAEVIS
ncbi:hypothetical protein M758_2G170100, partial [Ceratodon purpureus]